jgi:proteic killer suppression protein
VISTKVMIGHLAERQLRKVPFYIRDKLFQWIERVEEFGIAEVRIIKGFHDEPLKGPRIGERSIRLNRSYRAIYVENIDENLVLIKILEVTNHEY